MMILKETILKEQINIKTWFKTRTNQIIFVGVAFCFILILFSASEKTTSPGTAEQSALAAADDIDTFIPAGFVLVPIEIQNFEAVQAMVGAFAVVDLYSEAKITPVAQNLKLIRSPKDPSQMAVLVEENSSSQLVRYGQKPFLVVVQNRHKNQPQIVEKNQSTRLIWEDL